MTLNIPKSLQEFPAGAILNPLVNKTMPSEGLEELHIDVQTLGNLLLCFDAESESTVVIAGEEHLLPQRVERVGNRLVIEGGNMWAYFRGGQKKKILIEIHIPAQTKVNVSFTAGAVLLNGGEGDVYIQGRYGEIAGITHSKNVHINLRVGDVTINELSGAAEISLLLGSSTLGWTEFCGQEKVKVECKFGGIDLLLPPGLPSMKEKGVLFKEKRINSLTGTDIYAKIGLGGLDVLEWSNGE